MQALGSAVTIGFIVLTMGGLFLLINKTIGLRVGRDEELKGLDIGEHGIES